MTFCDAVMYFLAVFCSFLVVVVAIVISFVIACKRGVVDARRDIARRNRNG